MLTHPTLDKLRALRFTGMAKALEEHMQMADIDSLVFEERFGLLVDREVTERENRRLKTRLKKAKLRQNASIEDYRLSIPQRTGQVPHLKSFRLPMGQAASQPTHYWPHRYWKNLPCLCTCSKSMPAGIYSPLSPYEQNVSRSSYRQGGWTLHKTAHLLCKDRSVGLR